MITRQFFNRIRWRMNRRLRGARVHKTGNAFTVTTTDSKSYAVLCDIQIPELDIKYPQNIQYLSPQKIKVSFEPQKILAVKSDCVITIGVCIYNDLCEMTTNQLLTAYEALEQKDSIVLPSGNSLNKHTFNLFINYSNKNK